VARSLLDRARQWMRPGPMPPATRPDAEAGDLAAGPAGFVEASFLLVLGRRPDEGERRERLRALEAGQSRGDLLGTLVTSTEFRVFYDGLKARGDVGEPVPRTEAALQQLGPDDAFVRRAYECILGRPGDEGGLAHYVMRLGQGVARTSTLRSLILSLEFEQRYMALCPQAGFIPRDVQLCELANPAKWDNPEWLSLLRSLAAVPADKLAMHRKGYEFTQTVFGLARLGWLRDDVRVLSVGAGHECVLFWLANHVGHVVATDLYDVEWRQARAGEGDERVTRRPEDFAPFPFRQDRLSFLKMDGRRLAFADGAFDVAYSLSSVEHFGGLAGAQAAVDEIARVLKPGGLLVLATEYCLAGPPHHEAFQPAEVRALVERPGLRLVQPIDERVYARYDVRPVDVRHNPYQTPHMVVRDGDSVFTSVIVFLERVEGEGVRS